MRFRADPALRASRTLDPEASQLGVEAREPEKSTGPVLSRASDVMSGGGQFGKKEPGAEESVGAAQAITTCRASHISSPKCGRALDGGPSAVGLPARQHSAQSVIVIRDAL